MGFIRRTPFLRWLLVTKDDCVVVAQWPNLPLWLAIVLAAAAAVLPEALRPYAHWAYFAAIVVWALMEIFSGVNPFRRILGSGVLIWEIYALLPK